jgi:hydroxymethylpyrimidine pyrophosphatase-like HAD family hydrolase
MNHNRVEYKVIPENRVVIATIKNTSGDALREFNKKFLSNATADLMLMAHTSEKFRMKNSYKSVARCHPEDVFDENKGKAIALKKLSEKYNKSLDKRLAHIMVAFDKTLETMDKYFEGRTFNE